jgi:hypothetical protein
VTAALLGLCLVQPDRIALDPDRLVFRGIEDDAPVRGQADNPQEFEAYNLVLTHAWQFAAEELAATANRDVTFRDLVAPSRQDFRLTLVRLDGRLLRLRKYPATKPLRAAGVQHLYEGWVFPDAGDSPLCFLATDPPDGLGPSQNYSPPVPVTAAGFVFKLMRYESAEPHPTDPARQVVRRAPLLMGRRLILRQLPPSPAPITGGLLPAVGGVLALFAAVGVGLTAWYRRGDRAVRAAVTDRRNENPFEDDRPSGG